MTPTFSVTGSRRHIFVPASAESLPQGSAPHQDPPIYRALMRTWADRGRTLPGRHDPEWVRLATPPSGLDQFGGTLDHFAASDPFAASDFFRGSFSVTRAPRGAGR
ncbi:hypothetical protein F9278_06630 [Streptomyces phaeolivaceus]|uniref:Uncharacterized protein n=1 Tax=Streptomyces phaeolivaceus TaxID=2653200 RepID=A0A5P8JYX4_9ACTN|nr:hypothetical protein [Streptomyces phaeolivaceus]QFQ95910.1 hypothetical protein F9278_06630 [Streptomyces phaeolivaceus]